MSYHIRNVPVCPQSKCPLVVVSRCPGKDGRFDLAGLSLRMILSGRKVGARRKEQRPFADASSLIIRLLKLLAVFRNQGDALTSLYSPPYNQRLPRTIK